MITAVLTSLSDALSLLIAGSVLILSGVLLPRVLVNIFRFGPEQDVQSRDGL